MYASETPRAFSGCMAKRRAYSPSSFMMETRWTPPAVWICVYPFSSSFNSCIARFRFVSPKHLQISDATNHSSPSFSTIRMLPNSILVKVKIPLHIVHFSFYNSSFTALYRVLRSFSGVRLLGKGFLSTPAGERLEEPYFAVFQRVKIDSDRAVLPQSFELPFLCLLTVSG